jgi:hypothetical protein
MTAQLSPIDAPHVWAADGAVHIHQVVSDDADLVALIIDAPDPVETLQQVLVVGAKAFAFSRTGTDVAVVQQEFAALVEKFGHITHEVLNDPEAGIHARLDTWRAEMNAVFTALFDSDRASSAIGKIDTVMREAGDRQLAATRRLLNPDTEESPLAHLMSAVREQISQVLDAVARLAEQTATQKAAGEAEARTMQLTAIKGLAFEDRVSELVTGIVARSGDVAEAVGNQPGSTGGKVGDVVVEVSRAGGRYAIECKDRKLGLRATLTELGQATANREAAAAIMVFARQDQCPVPEPFSVFDNLALLVLDKSQPDLTALRLACAWARTQVLSASGDANEVIDPAEIRSRIDEGRRILGRVTAIRRAHTTAVNQIQSAAEQLDELDDELSEVLGQIERALAS